MGLPVDVSEIMVIIANAEKVENAEWQEDDYLDLKYSRLSQKTIPTNSVALCLITSSRLGETHLAK